MIQDLIKSIDRVEYLLTHYPTTRDCDKTLWLGYCRLFCELDQGLTYSYDHFKSWLLKSDVPMFESLSRCRRKLQEKHPHLRGQFYHHKQTEAALVKEWSQS